MAFTRFSRDFATRNTIIAVDKNPLKIPRFFAYAGKFKIATPIINFMKVNVTSLSVSCRDSLTNATKGARNSTSPWFALSKFVS